MAKPRTHHGLILACIMGFIGAVLLWGSPLLKGLFPAPLPPAGPGAKPVIPGDHQAEAEARAHAADLAIPWQLRSTSGAH